MITRYIFYIVYLPRICLQDTYCRTGIQDVELLGPYTVLLGQRYKVLLTNMTILYLIMKHLYCFSLHNYSCNLLEYDSANKHLNIL